MYHTRSTCQLLVSLIMLEKQHSMVTLKACDSSVCGMFHITVALNMEINFSGGKRQVLD